MAVSITVFFAAVLIGVPWLMTATLMIVGWNDGAVLRIGILWNVGMGARSKKGQGGGLWVAGWVGGVGVSQPP